MSKGRREEFARFERFRDTNSREAIPDPNAPETFARSKLDWSELDVGMHRAMLARYRQLLALRHEHVVPRLAQLERGGSFEVSGAGLLRVDWALGESAGLHLIANLCDRPAVVAPRPPGRLFYPDTGGRSSAAQPDELGAWAVEWTLEI